MLQQVGKGVVALAAGVAFGGFVPVAQTVETGRLDLDRGACLENGGWFHLDSGVCELDVQDDVTPPPVATAAPPPASQD